MSLAIKGQNLLNNADFSNHTYVVYETNTPGNNHGNRIELVKIAIDTLEFRGHTLMFDSTKYADAGNTVNKFIWVDSNGKMSVSTKTTITWPYSQITGISANSPLYYTTGTFSIQPAGTSSDGALSSTDWNTFNTKQTLINGTGFVKAVGTTISYDNNAYVPMTNSITINGITKTFTSTPTFTVGDALVANPLSQFASTTSAQLAGVISNETGSGLAVFSNSASLVSPNLDTPSAATLTNCTGLPVSTGISGLGSGIANFLASPTSSNLATAVTDETGTVGNLVFSNSPLVTDLRTNPNTTSAGSAQLKLAVAGSTLMTTPEVGAIETSTTGAIYWTPTTSNRYQLMLGLVGSATLDFPSTGSGNASDLTLTVTGAAIGDAVFVGATNGSVPAKGTFFGWVSSSNTVTVRYQNVSDLTARDPASGIFKVVVNKN